MDTQYLVMKIINLFKSLEFHLRISHKYILQLEKFGVNSHEANFDKNFFEIVEQYFLNEILHELTNIFPIKMKIIEENLSRISFKDINSFPFYLWKIIQCKNNDINYQISFSYQNQVEMVKNETPISSRMIVLLTLENESFLTHMISQEPILQLNNIPHSALEYSMNGEILVVEGSMRIKNWMLVHSRLINHIGLQQLFPIFLIRPQVNLNQYCYCVESLYDLQGIQPLQKVFQQPTNLIVVSQGRDYACHLINQDLMEIRVQLVGGWEDNAVDFSNDQLVKWTLSINTSKIMLTSQNEVDIMIEFWTQLQLRGVASSHTFTLVDLNYGWPKTNKDNNIKELIISNRYKEIKERLMLPIKYEILFMDFDYGKSPQAKLRTKIKYNKELNIDELSRFQNQMKGKDQKELEIIIDYSQFYQFQTLQERLLDLNEQILEMSYNKCAYKLILEAVKKEIGYFMDKTIIVDYLVSRSENLRINKNILIIIQYIIKNCKDKYKIKDIAKWVLVNDKVLDLAFRNNQVFSMQIEIFENFLEFEEMKTTDVFETITQTITKDHQVWFSDPARLAFIGAVLKCAPTPVLEPIIGRFLELNMVELCKKNKQVEIYIVILKQHQECKFYKRLLDTIEKEIQELTCGSCSCFIVEHMFCVDHPRIESIRSLITQARNISGINLICKILTNNVGCRVLQYIIENHMNERKKLLDKFTWMKNNLSNNQSYRNAIYKVNILLKKIESLKYSEANGISKKDVNNKAKYTNNLNPELDAANTDDKTIHGLFKTNLDPNKSKDKLDLVKLPANNSKEGSINTNINNNNIKTNLNNNQLKFQDSKTFSKSDQKVNQKKDESQTDQRLDIIFDQNVCNYDKNELLINKNNSNYVNNNNQNSDNKNNQNSNKSQMNTSDSNKFQSNDKNINMNLSNINANTFESISENKQNNKYFKTNLNKQFVTTQNNDNQQNNNYPKKSQSNTNDQLIIDKLNENFNSQFIKNQNSKVQKNESVIPKDDQIDNFNKNISQNLDSKANYSKNQLNSISESNFNNQDVNSNVIAVNYNPLGSKNQNNSINSKNELKNSNQNNINLNNKKNNSSNNQNTTNTQLNYNCHVQKQQDVNNNQKNYSQKQSNIGVSNDNYNNSNMKSFLINKKIINNNQGTNIQPIDNNYVQLKQNSNFIENKSLNSNYNISNNYSKASAKNSQFENNSNYKLIDDNKNQENVASSFHQSKNQKNNYNQNVLNVFPIEKNEIEKLITTISKDQPKQYKNNFFEELFKKAKLNDSVVKNDSDNNIVNQDISYINSNRFITNNSNNKSSINLDTLKNIEKKGFVHRNEALKHNSLKNSKSNTPKPSLTNSSLKDGFKMLDLIQSTVEKDPSTNTTQKQKNNNKDM